MADLESDIVGQVARLPLKPTEGNALLPLFEAVSNALHAISDRFGDKDIAGKGRIDIEVLRTEAADGTTPVTGFTIADNGIGLNDANFQAFRVPFTQHKLSRGGKGVGRLGWLRVFDRIDVSSRYINGRTELSAREFAFILRPKNQIEERPVPEKLEGESGTTIRLEGYQDAYRTRCPSRTEIIVQRLIGHFLPIFAGDRSPRIYLRDGSQMIDVRDAFRSKIHASIEDLINIEIEGKEHPVLIRHMKCDKNIRPRGSDYNWMCFCANDRGVKEYGIDEQIGLKSLDGEQIYIGTVTGDYLDVHVNAQRIDFIFDPEEGRAIRRQVAGAVREFLKDYIEEALAQKRALTTNVIRKNPQYIYLQHEINEFVSSLQPSSNNEERIYVEMAQHRFRRQRHFNGLKADIESAPTYDEAITLKVEEYKKYVADDSKGSLAEYVVRRKAILELLDKLSGFRSEDVNYYLENAIHELVCPMRVSSNEISIEDHNLWILDDRLAFFRFFASDLPLKTYTGSDSTREPDIALFYDSCIAWRESERVCDTVILVEFKRPGKDSYNESTDPFMQLIDYVVLFKSGKTVRDRKGNIISGIGPNTAFHCYIVADLTEGLRRRLRGQLAPTPDGKGLFGYTVEPRAYVEVIPYDKLRIDAQARNAVFFDKLGLTDP